MPKIDAAMSECRKLLTLETIGEWRLGQDEWVQGFPEELREEASRLQRMETDLECKKRSYGIPNKTRQASIDFHEAEIAEAKINLGLTSSIQTTANDLGNALGQLAVATE